MGAGCLHAVGARNRRLQSGLPAVRLSRSGGGLGTAWFFFGESTADHNFSATAVAAAAPAIRQVYGRLGAGDRFLLLQPDCCHDFPPATREQAYAFLDRVVAGRVASR